VTLRRYLSPYEIAKALDVSVKTVYRWIDDGYLPAERLPNSSCQTGRRRVLKTSFEKFKTSLEKSCQ
jgi:excisionase family DNA binding protein